MLKLGEVRALGALDRPAPRLAKVAIGLFRQRTHVSKPAHSLQQAAPAALKPNLKHGGSSGRPAKRPRMVIPAAAEIGAAARRDEELDPDEVEARIRKAANLIATSERLVPFDESMNMGLYLWRAIRDIPLHHRPKLLSRLSSGDIVRLWKMAGRRYIASPGAVGAALGPDYSLWKYMPADEAEIAHFSGKAALPLHSLGVPSFSKAFFLLAAEREDDDEEPLFGRVIHPTPVANWVWPGPLYFRSTIGPTVVPATNELCEMTISYLEPEELQLTDNDIPRSAWPRPRRQLRPFNAGYTDYVRAAGPGVLVGMGYRTQKAGSGLIGVPSPLFFVMIQQRVESLRIMTE